MVWQTVSVLEGISSGLDRVERRDIDWLVKRVRF